MVSSKGPAENLGLRSPSSSNLESVSCKELMVLEEKGGGSLTDAVRKLYLEIDKKKTKKNRRAEKRETGVCVLSLRTYNKGKWLIFTFMT